MIPNFAAMKAYVIVGAIIGAGLAGAVGAWKIQEWRYKAAEVERIEAEQENQRLRARVADKASEGHETDKVVIKTEFQTIYRDIEHVIEKPLYRNVCFDDDGLQQLQRAVGAKPATGEPAPVVPGPERTK